MVTDTFQYLHTHGTHSVPSPLKVNPRLNKVENAQNSGLQLKIIYFLPMPLYHDSGGKKVELRISCSD